jgi:NAD-dependent SIR2 family protein deacetylase
MVYIGTSILISQAHKAIAECESRLRKQGRRLVVITQNIDGLHARAGSANIIELHGEFCCFPTASKATSDF